MTEPHTAPAPSLLDELARHVPGVIYQFRLSPDGQSSFPFASDAIREIYEVTPDDVREDASIVFERIHPDDLAEGLRSIERSARDLSMWEWDYRVILPVRGLRHLHGRARPERLEDGSTIWHGFISDVTERRAEHEQLRRLQVAIDTSITGISLADLSGRITYVNQAALDLWGYADPAEVLGRSVAEFWEPGEQSVALYQTMMRTGEDAGVMTARRPDGSVRHVQVRANVINEQDGRPIGIIASLLDITEAKRLQAQLAQAQRMQTVGRLAGGVAHDFNNLLTVMKGFLALARAQIDTAAPLANDLGEVEHAVDSATTLTQQLLAFSRRQVTAPQVLDLNDAVRDVRAILERLLGSEVELRTVLAEAPARIRFDPNQLEQLLINLAVNARDAMPAGGCLTIETSQVLVEPDEAAREPVLRTGPHVQMLVRDTGSGIAQDIRAQLFEPFFTTKPTGQGTGLGLAMVYGAVTQHEGRIEVVSAADEGACFRILLPRQDAPVPRRTPPHATVLPRGTETVVVAEDEPAIRLLTVRVLEKQGYTVHAFASGPEALAGIRAMPAPPDLLLTDVIMPEMNGRALAEAVGREWPGTRVLFVSGYTEDVIGRHGILEANVDFLAKPYAVGTLAQRVRDALDRRVAR